MREKFGEKLHKIAVEGLVVTFEKQDGGDEINGTAQPSTKSAERFSNTGKVAVRAKPVALLHFLQGRMRFGRKIGAAGRERGVEFGDKLWQGCRRKRLPIASDEVVVKNVDKNPAKPSKRRIEPLNTAAENCVRIGVGIDLTMLLNAALEIGGKIGQGLGRNEIGQDGAEPKLRRGFG